jgi:serine/threonine protein phosphatase 1
MRILAIGDIHGHRVALDAVLAAVAPGPKDWIITVGDYVDRGPDSKGVLDRMLELQKGGNLIALRGNHEEMMMVSREEPGILPMWVTNGGQDTLDSYGTAGRRGLLDDVPKSHWNFLDHVCIDWFETDRHFYVHADAVPNVGFSAQRPQTLRWQKLLPHPRHFSGKTMICGHTVQPSGKPLDLGFAVCIDTGIYLPDGKLTCLDVESGDYWQSDAAGNITTSSLAKDKEPPPESAPPDEPTPEV